jgi:hypothetical protein
VTLSIATITVDAHDVEAQGAFWAAVLHGAARPPDQDGDVFVDLPDGTKLLFMEVPDTKTVKNRMHLDLRPGDQAAEVERVLALGATRADVGQTGEESFVVLADPEGNEFCILRAL